MTKLITIVTINTSQAISGGNQLRFYTFQTYGENLERDYIEGGLFQLLAGILVPPAGCIPLQGDYTLLIDPDIQIDEQVILRGDFDIFSSPIAHNDGLIDVGRIIPDDPEDTQVAVQLLMARWQYKGGSSYNFRVKDDVARIPRDRLFIENRCLFVLEPEQQILIKEMNNGSQVAIHVLINEGGNLVWICRTYDDSGKRSSEVRTEAVPATTA